ncbi:MAG: hypothetical protein ACR2LQ_05590 [Acidimicrobiales bacterium]
MGIAFLALMATAFAVFVVAGRRQRDSRAARAATVRFNVDARGIERELADGRHEAVAWSEVRQVDVVTLPKGPWAERARIVLHGSSAERGCIVPLDVAESGGLLDALGRLPSFDHDALRLALAEARTGTAVVWERAVVA